MKGNVGTVPNTPSTYQVVPKTPSAHQGVPNSPLEHQWLFDIPSEHLGEALYDFSRFNMTHKEYKIEKKKEKKKRQIDGER